MATSSTSSTSGSAPQESIDRLSETAHSTVDRAAQAAAQAAEQFGARGEEWLAMKDEYVEQAREYVKENPIVALGIALAAGYLFGKITGR